MKQKNILKNENHRSQKYLFVSLFIIAALLLRVLYLFQYSASPMFRNIVGPDVGEYYKWAESILNGNLIWKATSIHSPLYPYYLALLMFVSDGNLFFIRLLQMIVGMSANLLLFNLIYNFKSNDDVKSKFIAYSFLFLSFFFVPLIFYQGEIISEALLIPLICFAISALYKAENPKMEKKKFYLIIAGIILGFSVITHPISIFFIFAEFVYLFVNYLLFLKREKIFFPKYLISFLLPIILIAGSISLYNTYLEKDVVFVQRNSGYNLFLGNNSKANGMCNISAGPEWRKIHTDAELNAEKMGISKDAYFYRQVYDYIVNNPVEWIKLLCRKALLVWNCKDIYSSLDPLPVKYFTEIMYRSQLFFGILAVIALFGLFSIIRKPYKCLYEYRHFLMLVVSIWIGLTLTVVSDRYRYLMLPGLFVLFPYGIHTLYKSKEKIKTIIIASLYLIVSIIVVYLPIYKIDISKDTAFADSMFGEAYFESENFEMAEYFLHKALVRFPEWDRCYINLGIIEMEKNPKNAIKYFKKAYKLAPGNSTPLLNIALAYQLLNNKVEAGKYFKAAFDLDKKTSEITFNYAFFLFKENKSKDALTVLYNAEENKIMTNKIRNLIGVIYLKEEKINRAVFYFKQAVFYSPENINYKLNLAFAYIENKNYDNAKDIIEKILKKYPDNQRALMASKKLFNNFNKQ